MLLTAETLIPTCGCDAVLLTAETLIPTCGCDAVLLTAETLTLKQVRL